MTSLWAALVYLLCLFTSAVCAGLLFRAWRKERNRLLFWTAFSFLFLALNNLALVADILVFTKISLWMLRFLLNLIALSVLLYGFIWETER
jgi:hypothetical protein